MLAIVIFVSARSAKRQHEALHAGSLPTNVIVTDSGDSGDDGITLSFDQGENVGTDLQPIKIVFPDGYEHPVTYRDPPPFPNKVHKPDNLAQGYSGLVEMANSGDAAAAAVLHEGLFGCGGFYYRTEAEMEEMRLSLVTTQTYKTVDPSNGEVSPVFIDDVDDIEIALQVNEAMFKACKGVTAEMVEEAAFWQQTAAKLGDPREMKKYVLSQLGNSAEGRSLLTKAFMDGFYDAGTALGSLLIGERVPLLDINDPILPSEYDRHVEGVAYYYLAVQLGFADSTFNSTGMPRRIQSQFEKAISHLPHHEQQAGIERAKEILKVHDKCCWSSTPTRKSRSDSP